MCIDLPHLQAACTSGWGNRSVWREAREERVTPVLCLRGVTGLLVAEERAGEGREGCGMAASADSCLVGVK